MSTFSEEMQAALLGQLIRIGDALERLANNGKPVAPNHTAPLEEYGSFDWAGIGADVVQKDKDGPTHVSWGGMIFTRRSPSNKFEPAIWFSTPNGRNEAGDVQYLRLITFKTLGGAEALGDKLSKTVNSRGGWVQAMGIVDIKTKTQEQPPANGNTRPYTPEQVKARIAQISKELANTSFTDKQRSSLNGILRFNLERLFAGEPLEKVASLRHTVCFYLTGHESTNDVPLHVCKALLDGWLKPHRDSGGEFIVDPMAVKEAGKIVAEHYRNEGQQELDL